MRETVNTKDVVSGLRLDRHQIEQWVARDMIRPTHEAKGRAGREWTYRDVFAISLLDLVSTMGLPVSLVREPCHFGFVLPRDLERFLVIEYGGRFRLIPDSRGLSPSELAEMEANAQVVTQSPHHTVWDVYSAKEVAERMEGGVWQGAVVLPLKPLGAKVSAIFNGSNTTAN